MINESTRAEHGAATADAYAAGSRRAEGVRTGSDLELDVGAVRAWRCRADARNARHELALAPDRHAALGDRRGGDGGARATGSVEGH